MKINNVEFDFRIAMLVHAAKLVMAMKDMEKQEKSLNAKLEKKGTMLAEIVRDRLELFRTFFKTISGVDVVGDCDDLNEVTEMYYVFLDEIQEQKKTLIMPYSPDRIK